MQSIANRLMMAFFWLIASTVGQEDRVSGALNFTYQVCTALGKCQSQNAGLVIGYSWRGCANPKTCYNIPSANTYQAWGIRNSGGNLTFNFQPTSGAGLFVTNGNGSNQYLMFQPLNMEMSFDINLSTVGCGLNAALFLTATPADGGIKSYGYTGPTYGTGYCDAQAAVQYKPTCAEMDIWEGNSLSAVYSTHPCYNQSTCDASGCGFNPYQLGNRKFYGRGSSHSVDTTKIFTVVTRFVTTDGTKTGNLKEVQRYYIQNGRKINNPTIQNYSSLSDDFCHHFGQPDASGVTVGLSSALKQGMMLTMALWGDLADKYMTWLDAGNNGPCPSYNNSNANVMFSNLKFGPIGSTN